MRSDGDSFLEPLHVGRPNIGDRTRLAELLDGVLDRRWLTNDGPLVRELETRIAERIGVEHCVAVANGTLGLELAIDALGLRGEVIVPSFTFVATAHALRSRGIRPVFADIDPRTHNLSPEAVRRAITPDTTGILAVHLWGRPAAVEELQQLADEHGLTLLFDAAHAFGASVGSRSVGRFGRAEVFSFHATKFFNTVEGGAVATDDPDLARRLRLMRNFGFSGEDTVVSEGTNAKLSEFHAAAGLVNLDAIDGVIAVNQRNRAAYATALEGIPGISLLELGGDGSRNFQYVVMLVEADCMVSRDHVLQELRARNVLARRYFWPGVHRMEPYRTSDPDAGAMLPETERVADQVIVLPTGTAVDQDAILRIGRIVRAIVTSA